MTMPPGAIPIPNISDDERLARITRDVSGASRLIATPDVHYLLKIIRRQNLVLRIIADGEQVARSSVLIDEPRGPEISDTAHEASGAEVDGELLRSLKVWPLPEDQSVS